MSKKQYIGFIIFLFVFVIGISALQIANWYRTTKAIQEIQDRYDQASKADTQPEQRSSVFPLSEPDTELDTSKKASTSAPFADPDWTDFVHTVDPSVELLTPDLETQDDSEGKEEPLVDSSGRELDPRDPYDLYEIMLKAFLEKHGDIPEVYIVAEEWLKMNLGQKQTPEEKLTVIEAMYHLNPHPATRRSIEIQKLIVAGDYETLSEKYGESQPESEQPFYGVSHFFEGQTQAEGFRQLRAADPKRFAEFVEFIKAEARTDPLMSLEEIEREIQRSYEPTEKK